MDELPIIQKTYDLIKWYIPILNRLPRDHKFMLGDRMISGLYDLLEGLIQARYSPEKLTQLEILNTRIDILRHQTRLLLDFELVAAINWVRVAGGESTAGEQLPDPRSVTTKSLWAIAVEWNR
ncbi:MAG: diversity-generating retroelement protein Avd [Leptolyngbyaceae cyanobacterium CAN_BIN12]|nr:diversity-generating retroelement protein Avd [Leptolyngbyaceae cyanobacterium CAN_BIN12]